MAASEFARTLRGPGSFREDVPKDRGLTAASENRFAFEAAWEVANKGMCLYCNRACMFTVLPLVQAVVYPIILVMLYYN